VVEVLSLKKMSSPEKCLLLKELGYKTDGQCVYSDDNEVIKDEYVGVDVRFDNMIIMPGTVKILDNNELSIALYLEEYGDRFEFS